MRNSILGLVLFFIAFGVGCGGGGSSTNKERSDPVETAAGVSQVFLAGPLSHAEIVVHRLSDLSTPVQEPIRTRSPAEGYSLAGSFVLELYGIPDDEWLLITAHGGEDIDTNSDGVADDFPTTHYGSINALARAVDLRNGITVNPLSDWMFQVYSGLGYLERDDPLPILNNLVSRLDTMSTSANGFAYNDILQFVPERDRSNIEHSLWANIAEHFISRSYLGSPRPDKSLPALGVYGEFAEADYSSDVVLSGQAREEKIGFLRVDRDGATATGLKARVKQASHEIKFEVLDTFGQEISLLTVSATDNTFFLRFINESPLLPIISSDLPAFLENPILPDVTIDQGWPYIEIAIPSIMVSSFKESSVSVKMNGQPVHLDDIDVVSDNPVLRLSSIEQEFQQIAEVSIGDFRAEARQDGLVITALETRLSQNDRRILFAEVVNNLNTAITGLWDLKVSAITRLFAAKLSANLTISSAIDSFLIQPLRDTRQLQAEYSVWFIDIDGNPLPQPSRYAHRVTVPAGDWLLPIISYRFPASAGSSLEPVEHKLTLRTGRDVIALPTLTTSSKDLYADNFRIIAPLDLVCFERDSGDDARTVEVEINGGAVGAQRLGQGTFVVDDSGGKCGPKVDFRVMQIGGQVSLDASSTVFPDTPTVEYYQWDIGSNGVIDHQSSDPYYWFNQADHPGAETLLVRLIVTYQLGRTAEISRVIPIRNYQFAVTDHTDLGLVSANRSVAYRVSDQVMEVQQAVTDCIGAGDALRSARSERFFVLPADGSDEVRPVAVEFTFRLDRRQGGDGVVGGAFMREWTADGISGQVVGLPHVDAREQGMNRAMVELKTNTRYSAEVYVNVGETCTETNRLRSTLSWTALD